MNANLQRGILLFQQSRPEMAEAEFRQALASEPDDAYAHALLALCLLKGARYQDATAEAQTAVHLQPDFPFAHYALAHVFYSRNCYPEALSAAGEAIRLAPEDPDYLSLLASIHMREQRWGDALRAADQGLQFDPEHIRCTNLRATALVKLGRRAEAGRTMDAALAKNPEDAPTHANQGWTFLEKGEPKKALEHFREALRLDPENQWARQGIVEALKARNILYAVMLKYFLWMSRFSRRGQWAIVLGGYFGNRILGALEGANPALAPWVHPLRLLYVCFALMTWMATPFFNLLLRLNRFGRLVLSREQTIASNWFGLCLLGALLGLAGCCWSAIRDPSSMGALVFGALLIPVSGVFRCPAGSPRRIMAGLTICLALLGTAAILVEVPAIRRTGLDGGLSGVLFIVVMFGAVGSTWLVNILHSQRPRRK
jgi:tetratricopeptide (TPR) repeat protein